LDPADARGFGVGGFTIAALAEGVGACGGSSSSGTARVGAGIVTTGCGRGGLVDEGIAAGDDSVLDEAAVRPG
jgi:hypothetical protein